jgi:hypothetical protein
MLQSPPSPLDTHAASGVVGTSWLFPDDPDHDEEHGEAREQHYIHARLAVVVVV